jgi:hypothetical protein
MTHPVEHPIGDDDLARQRRKREARLLDQEVPGFPGVILADIVADVLAASDADPTAFDVGGYLQARGHGWQTVEAVVGYLQRQNRLDSSNPQQPRVL